MSQDLQGKKVAILVADGFEQVELEEPRLALQQAGADTQIVSPNSSTVKGWRSREWGEELSVDVQLDQANPEDYDALLLPGGVMNPDKLRTNRAAIRFVRSIYESEKPIAAICHAPWMLIEAGLVYNKKLTSWPSLKTDVLDAGGDWVDEEVVTDQGIVTSRRPDDIPAFNQKMIEQFALGDHGDLGGTSEFSWTGHEDW